MKFHQAKTIIKYISEEDYTPSDWEKNFIKSVLDRGADLTPKQENALSSMYAKATGGGIYQNRERA